MTHPASIGVIADSIEYAGAFLGRLRGLGFEAAASTPRSFRADPASSDILFLQDDLPASEAFDLAAQAVTISPPPVICAVKEEYSPAFDRLAFEAGFDDILTQPCPDEKLLARLLPLTRVSTLRKEVSIRRNVAAGFGVSLPPLPLPETREPRLIVVGDPGVLEGVPVQATMVKAGDPYEAADILDGDPGFDAAILAPVDEASAYLDLCSNLRGNPRLFNLPVIFVAPGTAIDEVDAYRHGASDVFLRPLAPHLLASSLRFLVRRQRLRWSLRDGITTTLSSRTADTETGLYGEAFFAAALERHAAEADSRRRSLSAVIIRIPDIERIRVRYGSQAGGHLRHQLAQWICCLLRVEDLAAALGDSEFGILLPDTANSEAERVMHRIGGVLTNTDFAVKTVYQPVTVWSRESCGQLGAGETPPDFLARLRRTLS